MGLSWGADVRRSTPTGDVPPAGSLRVLLPLALAFLLGAVLTSFAVARPSNPLPACHCGHPAQAHEHVVRIGTRCRCCPRSGEDACTAYEPGRVLGQREPEPPPPDGEDLAAAFLLAVGLADQRARHLRPVAAH